jgi:hypothetical protein
MPGWQITLIVAAAGVLAAALAVLANRKRAARLAGDLGVRGLVMIWADLRARPCPPARAL